MVSFHVNFVRCFLDSSETVLPALWEKKKTSPASHSQWKRFKEDEPASHGVNTKVSQIAAISDSDHMAIIQNEGTQCVSQKK
uniref:Uncharacterized protein n=1 Tax=Sphaerodactylus townsendi TaxID=933632 RepID=A0ACB8EQZ7_9SAUR